MEWGFGFGAGILITTLAYLAGRLTARMDHPRRSEIVDPGASQGPSRDEFDTLAGKLKKISLEWEDTHERLLRMARSARAAARAAGLSDNGGTEEDGRAKEPPDASLPLSRAAVLAAYRRRHASRQ